MLSLTNACRKGKQLLFALLFLAQHAYSMDPAFLSCPARGDSINPEGDLNERNIINEALALLSRTNPEIYKDILEAKEVFVISISDFSSSNNVNPDYRHKTTVFFASSYMEIEQEGSFAVDFKEHYALKANYSPGSGFLFSRGGTNSDEEERVIISEEEADSLIILKDPIIMVQAGLCRKKFAMVLAHEFGHADYILKHKARAEFYPADPTLLAHDKGNPDGEAADAAERQFDKVYKKAVRALRYSITESTIREAVSAVR
jgi:hypothetical protein